MSDAVDEEAYSSAAARSPHQGSSQTPWPRSTSESIEPSPASVMGCQPFSPQRLCEVHVKAQRHCWKREWLQAQMKALVYP